MSSKRFHTDPSFADALIPQSPRKTFYDQAWCNLERVKLRYSVAKGAPTHARERIITPK